MAATLAERRTAAKEFLADVYSQVDAFGDGVADDKIIAETIESLKNCVAVHAVIVGVAIQEAEILRK